MPLPFVFQQLNRTVLSPFSALRCYIEYIVVALSFVLAATNSLPGCSIIRYSDNPCFSYGLPYFGVNLQLYWNGGHLLISQTLLFLK